MDNPVFSPDSAGRWIWRTKLFYSDRTFGSEAAEISDWKKTLDEFKGSWLNPTPLPKDR
ncbi:hypothetical protein [Adonisia turfae]|uniref:hypothetical protein n=1 Tax=Adonisia turfae TaxID=2950184 RepID=UPI0013D84DCE|nr:hypothetical protein [Adonisia turfae]